MKGRILYAAAALAGCVYLAAGALGGLVWSSAVGLVAAFFWGMFFARVRRGLWALLLASAVGCVLGCVIYVGADFEALDFAALVEMILLNLAAIAVWTGFWQDIK